MKGQRKKKKKLRRGKRNLSTSLRASEPVISPERRGKRGQYHQKGGGGGGGGGGSLIQDHISVRGQRGGGKGSFFPGERKGGKIFTLFHRKKGRDKASNFFPQRKLLRGEERRGGVLFFHQEGEGGGERKQRISMSIR